MTDDKRKKKRGRSKIFRSCFRSSGTIDGPSSSDISDGRDTKNERLGKPVLVAVSGGKGKDFYQDVDLVNGGVANNRGDPRGKRSSAPRRRISRIFNAILFNTKVNKIHKSSSKSSIASDTSSSSVSSEKIGKSIRGSNAYGREYTEIDDSCSRSNLLSSSTRTTSSVYSTSSSSSNSSDSQSSSEQKSSSQIDRLDFRHPVSFNSSTLKKSNPLNSSSRSCFDQKVSFRTDSLQLRRQESSKSLPLPKPKPINSIPQPFSYQKGLSRLDSLDSRNSASSNSHPLTKASPDKIKSGNNNWNIRWCLFLLLSLVVLVIWGRLSSILCTSIWFYFVPCRRVKRVDSVPNLSEYLDTESELYKKRVIMAGLLERTRNPIR